LAKAYIEKGWRVIAAVRDPNKMPEVGGGEVVVVKLDAGEKEDAKKVRSMTVMFEIGLLMYRRLRS
jgi:uncharacterized protein YbjT (DUF2867 family)